MNGQHFSKLSLSFPPILFTTLSHHHNALTDIADQPCGSSASCVEGRIWSDKENCHHRCGERTCR